MYLYKSMVLGLHGLNVSLKFHLANYLWMLQIQLLITPTVSIIFPLFH